MKTDATKFGKLILAGIVMMYSAVTLPFLEQWPPLQYDECWIGAVAYNLHVSGRFSTHVFGDLLDLDRLSLDRMPLHSYWQAAILAFFDFGIWQLRLPSVLLGMGIIILTYQLIRNWLGVKAALIGAAVVSFGRLCLIEPYLGLGIMDVAINARHDITVAFFSLWSMKVFIAAEKSGRLRQFIEAGAAGGLALLTHLYALVLPAAYIAFWSLNTRSPRELWKKRFLSLATLIIVASPWLLFVGANWSLARQQFLFFQGAEKLGAELGRFTFLDASFYINNIWREYLRYYSIGRHAASEILPGIFVAFALAGWVRALARAKSGQAVETKFLAVALPVMMFLLAAFETFKYQAYLTFLAPLWTGAMVFAWQRFAELSPATIASKWMKNSLYIFVSGLFLFHGARSVKEYWHDAGTHATFAEISRHFHQFIPLNASVVGSQRYWPAFRYQRFYDYQVPTARVRRTSYNKTAMDLQEWFAKTKPDFIVYDVYWRQWAFEHRSFDYADPRTREQLARILAEDCELLSKTDFPGYGETAIYRVKNESPE